MRKRALSDDDVMDIMRLYMLGYRASQLAEKYNVSLSLIRKVIYGRGGYKNVI